MLPYARDAIENLTVWIDPAVQKSCARRGPWSTMVRVKYEDYGDHEDMLAVEVADRIRPHAKAEISVINRLTKSRDLTEYITRMES